MIKACLSGIVSFVHCRHCVMARRRSYLDVGLVDADTLRVWCTTCNTKVADLPMARPMALRCDPAGKGPQH